MIRRSVTVALIAIFVSLMLHWLGLGWQFAGLRAPQEQTEQQAPEAPDVGGDFEELAEPLPETPAPEPARQAPPEQLEPVETPTTEALVASDNPSDVIAPDAPAEAAAEDAAPDAPPGQEADEVAQEAGQDETNADIAALEPNAPEPLPEAEPESVPQADPEPAPEPETSDQATPDIIKPLQPDAVEPEAEPEVQPDTETAALAPEATAPDVVIEAGEPDITASAVTRSLRPPKRRPTAEELGVPERPVRQATRSAPRYESPITAYKRNGSDLLALGRIGQSPGGLSFSGSGGSGNSGTTNYAGRVLVKLNRGPLLNRSEKGMARVYFQINPDGSVGWVRILNTSGSSGIAAAAQAQVRSAAPFPRPPGGKPEQLVFVYRNR